MGKQIQALGILNWKSWGAVLSASLFLGACSTAGRPIAENREAAVDVSASRAPASAPLTVVRKLFVEAGEEGTEWLAKLLGKGAEGEALAGRIRNGLSTLKSSEIREDQKLLSILSKDVADVSESDARYLLDVASNRAVSLANCSECVARRKEFLGYRKVIRERMMASAGSSRDGKKHVVGFLKRVETLLDKGMAEPKQVSEFMAAINAERFKGADVEQLLDTVQVMLLSVGKDIDPKAAADIINSWPDTSLKGLRKFYSEVVMAQASEGLEVEQAAETVLRRLNVTDPEEIKVMKVCSLIKR